MQIVTFSADVDHRVSEAEYDAKSDRLIAEATDGLTGWRKRDAECNMRAMNAIWKRNFVK